MFRVFGAPWPRCTDQQRPGHSAESRAQDWKGVRRAERCEIEGGESDAPGPISLGGHNGPRGASRPPDSRDPQGLAGQRPHENLPFTKLRSGHELPPTRRCSGSAARPGEHARGEHKSTTIRSQRRRILPRGCRAQRRARRRNQQHTRSEKDPAGLLQRGFFLRAPPMPWGFVLPFGYSRFAHGKGNDGAGSASLDFCDTCATNADNRRLSAAKGSDGEARCTKTFACDLRA